MPARPLKPCTYRWAPCAELIPHDERFCPTHKKDFHREDRLIRGSAAARGYDHRWNKLRKAALKRDDYLCQAMDDQGCKKLGIMTPATDVDHIQPFDGIDDPLRLDLNNTQSMCEACHQRKTAADQKRSTIFTPQPIPKRKKLSFA